MAITRSSRNRARSSNGLVKSRTTTEKNEGRNSTVEDHSKRRGRLKELNTKAIGPPHIQSEDTAVDDAPGTKRVEAVSKSRQEAENDKPIPARSTRLQSRKYGKRLYASIPASAEPTKLDDNSQQDARTSAKEPTEAADMPSSPTNRAASSMTSIKTRQGSNLANVDTEVDDPERSDRHLDSGQDDNDGENRLEAGLWPEEEPPPPGYSVKTSKKRVVRPQRHAVKKANSASEAILTHLSPRSRQWTSGKRTGKGVPCIVIDVDTEKDTTTPQDVVDGPVSGSDTDAKPREATSTEEQEVVSSERNRNEPEGLSLSATVAQTSAIASIERRIDAEGCRGGDAALEIPEEAKTERVTSRGARPKSFYGSKAMSSRLSPVTIQERLRALSFTRRDSFVPWADDQVAARSRKVKKHVGTRARKKVAAKNAPFKKTVMATRSRGCCSRAVREQGELRDVPSTIISLNPTQHPARAGNRFFKHHHPVSNVRVYYQGGMLKVAPHAASVAPKGPIDFDHKDNNISHVAEEGGKCDNFGLESVDDLERSGIVSRASLARGGLRKRKAPIIEDKKVKRKRPSMWRYNDKRSPVKRIPAGLTLEQYEDAQIREKFNFPNVWVSLERLPEPKPKRQRRRAFTPKRLSMDVNPPEQIPPAELLPVVVSTRVDSPKKVVQPPKMGGSSASSKSGIDEPEEEVAPMDIEPISASSPILGSAPASPCPSPAPSSSPLPKPPGPKQTSTPHTAIQAPSCVPSPSVHKAGPPPKVQPARKKYNPADDAFGFDKIDTPPMYRVRRMMASLLKISSPEKRPKELTPKVARSSQPTINQLLRSKVAGSVQTPAREDNIQVPSPFSRNLKPDMTSTPIESAVGAQGKRACSFYGKSPSVFSKPAVAPQIERDGFSGIKRLIDRLGKRQLQIDAGQEKFGAKACTRCGMVFSQGEAEDERQHERFHKQLLNAVRFKGWRTTNIVDVVPELGSAYLVSPHDVKSVRDKVEEVMKLANDSIGFDWECLKVDPVNHPERRYAIFATNSGKLASIVVIEPWAKAMRTVPGDELLVEDATTYDVSHSVVFAWTFPPYRRRGLASRLLFHLRAQLAGPGKEPIGFDRLAFSDPTPDLHKFVKGLTESETYLVAI